MKTKKLGMRLLVGLAGLFAFCCLASVVWSETPSGRAARTANVQTETARPSKTPKPTGTERPTGTARPPTDTPKPTKTRSPSPTPTSNAPDAPKGDGFYTVGVDILPGRWESTGSGSSCYWARHDDKQGILSNSLGDAGGTITILPTDYEVQFEDCGTWIYVEGLEREELPTATDPKEDGFYTVGVEIAAGKWESTGDADSCYWERLDDKQEILDNHLGNAGGTITIRPTDYEVHLSGCGTWVYVEGLEREQLPTAEDPKEDGFYTVGVEIAPGKWKSTVGFEICYWARLDGKQNVLDNHLGSSGGTVTIRATDYEVDFSGCGTWTYVGP